MHSVDVPQFSTIIKTIVYKILLTVVWLLMCHYFKFKHSSWAASPDTFLTATANHAFLKWWGAPTIFHSTIRMTYSTILKSSGAGRPIDLHCTLSAFGFLHYCIARGKCSPYPMKHISNPNESTHSEPPLPGSSATLRFSPACPRDHVPLPQNLPPNSSPAFPCPPQTSTFVELSWHGDLSCAATEAGCSLCTLLHFCVPVQLTRGKVQTCFLTHSWPFQASASDLCQPGADPGMHT